MFRNIQLPRKPTQRVRHPAFRLSPTVYLNSLLNSFVKRNISSSKS